MAGCRDATYRKERLPAQCCSSDGSAVPAPRTPNASDRHLEPKETVSLVNEAAALGGWKSLVKTADPHVCQDSGLPGRGKHAYLSKRSCHVWAPRSQQVTAEGAGRTTGAEAAAARLHGKWASGLVKMDEAKCFPRE